ncbi:hypothetical protein R530_23305 [Salmonella enterica subsp. arizonae serovar 50:r:z]|nr:hypothetical protein LFZ55_09225 [Salmonella enterica subsp. diarizonae serovar 65:c:z str. SA20044251]OSE44806.1 hypothetical protein R530_23305 [Salmonella enterica subsp. arizonae serovar 50:r:z]OSG09688.1 hypothetical protein R562_23495 [Salmonella enterica subsp. diarizonae serovar Rough:r:z]
MLSKTGFTHSELLCWQIDYAGGSLNVNGTIMRDTYKSSGMIFIAGLLCFFAHQSSFFLRNWCYDRHRSVRLVVWDIWRLIRSHNPG